MCSRTRIKTNFINVLPIVKTLSENVCRRFCIVVISEYAITVCKNKAINGEDEFDLLDNCCITAIRKFDEKDIDEQEGLDYLWRIFGAARFFRKKKVDKHLIFTELPPDIGVED